ncbi:hypothetical protein F5Y06DRAFT_278337 [Hypoxylon sp. FL0890]|nr:hypothetical protein F5Y06DRAFT_278337 [Hypoxylon sp. FL0890]
MMLLDNMDDTSPETEPLYPQSHCEDLADQRKSVRYERRNRSVFIYMFLAVMYFILVTFYIILFARYSRMERDIHAMEPDLFPSLARSSAFRRVNRLFSLTVAGTPFAGDPNAELDQAWHDLLEGTTIRVAKEDLDYYNVTSLPLADGSGYASELFVTHELHCLKKVRQWIYKDTYFTQIQGLARNELKRHIDHCIETLRQGIMCRGDVSLGTYTYLGGSRDVTARSWGEHQCIDFDALMVWMRERAVDIFQEGVLTSPEHLGPEHFTEKKPPH